MKLNLLANNDNMDDIWFGCQALLGKIGPKMTNEFWKETLKVFAKIMTEMPYSHPHFFL